MLWGDSTWFGALANPNPGIYPAFPGNVTWISVNMAGDYKRAAGMAIYIGIGNLAGGKNITSVGIFSN